MRSEKALRDEVRKGELSAAEQRVSKFTSSCVALMKEINADRRNDSRAALVAVRNH